MSKDCSDMDQSQQLGRNGLFLKAYPFLTPILETYFRKAYMNFAGGLSTFGVRVLEHRKKYILHFWSLRQSSPCGNAR